MRRFGRKTDERSGFQPKEFRSIALNARPHMLEEVVWSPKIWGEPGSV